MTEAQTLALACIKHVNWFELDFSQDAPGCSQAHILKILEHVADGEVTGEKAHRFIGWAQGVLCMEGYLTLDDARDMNRKVIEKLQ